MTILSDFTHIVGDDDIKIGDDENANGFPKEFSTGGRVTWDTAFITFMVKGMTATTQNADVFVNNKKVGVLFNNNGGNPNHWHTQTVSMGGAALNDGEDGNLLKVGTVENPLNTGGNLDDYFIRNVICHFHQNG